MRRMTGLQAALAMIGGGLEGQAAQRAREEEQRRFDEDRLYQRQRDAAASERQALMDAVALAEKGYVEQGERAEMQKRATPALESALMNAGSVMRGQAPTAVPSAQNQAALRAAAGQFGPAASTVQVGGKTFERAQTPSQERRMVAEQELETQRGETMRANELARRQKQGDVQEQAGRIKAAFGDKITDAQALAIASGGAKISDFVPEELTPYQKAQLGMERERLDIARVTAQDKARQLPVGAQAKLAGYDSGVIMANDLRKMINENRDATGFKGLLWGPILDRLDQGGVGVRAAIEALSGEIRNQRFGGALTVDEAKYALTFLPDKRDNYATVIAKLDGLEKYLEQKRTGLFSAAGLPKPAPLYQRDETPEGRNDPRGLFTAPDSAVRNPYRD